MADNSSTPARPDDERSVSDQVGPFPLRLKCPHCQNPIVVVDRSADDVVCPSCGSSFRVDPDRTVSWSHDKLPNVGKFQLLAVVGRGAFGTVYRALDTELQRTVAVKTPRSGTFATKDDEDRFVREARNTAQLNHPGIVPIFEVARGDQFPYIVTEFVEGVTLADYLSGRRLAFRESAELIARAADAVDHAHRQGIVHRDLKPSNIMLHDETPVADGRSSPTALRPRILDFGLARRDDGEITVTLDGQVLGTPAYMSPEQARGESHRVDGRSDVYSLGVILYELLAGELPFRGTARMLLHQVIHDDPRPPRRVNDRIPRDLETICLKALAKEPQRRYGRAIELADDLRRFLAGDPVLARPPSLSYRLGKQIRKHRTALATAASILFAAVVGISIAFWRISNALEGERQANVLAKAAYVQEIQALDESERRGAELLRQKTALQAQISRTARSFCDLAVAEFEKHNVDDALVLMNRACQDAPDDDPLRASYLRIMGGMAPRAGIPLVHDGLISTAVFSPDGRRVATASYDTTARIWDVATGRPLGDPLRHEQPVFAVAFSPDGKQVLTASAGMARLWDLTTGRPLGKPMTHQGQSEVFAFSPDGSRILTATDDKTAQLWDSASGQPSGRPLVHDERIVSASFSPDGRRLLMGSHDKTAQLWDANSGRQIGETLKHEVPVDSVAFSPDGRTILTRSDRVRLWDASTNRPFGKLMPPEWLAVQAAMFSPDGRFILAAGLGGAQLLDAATGLPIGPPLRSDFFLQPTFSPDGRRVANTHHEGTYQLWDLGTGKPVTHFGRNGVLSIPGRSAFSPNGRWLLTIEDHVARLWDLAANHPPVVRSLDHEDDLDRYVFSIALTPDGGKILTLSESAVRLWDAISGQQLGSQTIRHEEGEFLATHLFVAPDGRTAVACSGSPASGIARDFRDGAVAFSNTAWLLDLTTCKRIGQPLLHEKYIIALAFSADGRRLLTGSDDQTARLWDLANGKIIGQPMRLGEPVGLVSFSADGQTLLTASVKDRFSARVWNATTCQPIGEPIRPLLSDGDERVPPVKLKVFPMTISFDGKNLLTAGQELVAQQWDVATGRPIGQSMHHDHGIRQVTYSRDGQAIMTLDSNQVLRLWNCSSGTPIAAPIRLDLLARLPTYSSNWQMFSYKSRVFDTATGKPITAALNDGSFQATSLFNATFFPDGQRIVVSGGEQKAARILQLPKPAPDDRKRLDAWVQWRTTRTTDETGSTRVLSVEQSHARHTQLESLGGEWINAVSDRTWHQGQTDDAELKEQWFAAEFHLGRLLAAEPNHTGFLIRRANANYSLQRWPEAEADCSKAIAIDATLAAAWRERGSVYAELGQWDQAAADFQQAAKLRPDAPLSAWLLGFARLAVNDAKGYREQCKQVMQRADKAPVPKDVLYQYADLILVTPAGREFEGFLQQIEQSSEPYADRRFGSALYRAGKLAQAKAVFEKEMTDAQSNQQPDVIWSPFFMAMTCHKLGDTEKAQQWLKTGKAEIADGAKRPIEKQFVWHWRIAHQVLLAETEALLKTPTPKTTSPPPKPAAKGK